MAKEVVKRKLDVSEVVFSDKSAQVMSSVLGIKPAQRNGFRAAYKLLPLSRAKECIDMAYQISLDGMDGVEVWIDRYAGLAQKHLPKWARKNSKDYLAQTYTVLQQGDRGAINTLLLEFRGFIYAVFCRALLQNYEEVKNG